MWYGPGVEEGGRGEAVAPIVSSQRGLLRLLALALLIRGAFSVIGAISPASGDLGPLRIGGLAEAVQSPLMGWAWGIVALAAGVALARRLRLGWLLAAAVCVAYLVVGVTEAFTFEGFGSVGPTGFWLAVILDLAVPALVLAGLFRVRRWFLDEVRV
ncbi:MAG: hypothetical protein ACHQ15_06975 [Candidatus Limnocylindrales bacterium]